MALPRPAVHEGAVRGIGAGIQPFPCTTDVITAVLRHVSGAKRHRLDPAVAAAITPWGGIVYLEWLFHQLAVYLPRDEQVILLGLLRYQSHTAIAVQLHRHRNWVTERIRDRLIPRLVIIVDLAAQVPHYSMQAMFHPDRAPMAQPQQG
jgi:hypothetical protein